MNNLLDRVIILMPAYNEAARISEVIANCKKYFKNIIIVEDGSSDSTFQEAYNSNPTFILKHCINCGQGASLATGIRYFLEETNYDYLITFDADGQHLPNEALSMLKYAVENNYKAVFGSRFLNKKSLLKVPKLKMITLNLAKLFERIFFGISLSDAHNGLRVLSRDACSKLISLDSSSMANGTEIAYRLLSGNIKIKEFPCTILYNYDEKKSQSPLAGLNIISDLLQKK